MNLIFDFDGTVCDSFEAGVEIVKNNFPEYYTSEITPEMARELGLRGLIKKVGFPKHKLPKLMFKGSKEMAKKIPSLKPFPHMKGVIKELSMDHNLGIITSNSEKNVKMFLNNHNMLKYFNFVYSSTSLFGKDKTINKVLKKYNMKEKDTIYIGDETRDIEAGKKAGTKTVAATWGYESESVLKKAKPDVVVGRPVELLRYFK